MRRRIALVGIFTLASCWAGARDFYVDPKRGDDHADGASVEHPWRTVERASRAELQAGDRVSLARGERHVGQLYFEGLAGEAGAPITITSYAPPGTNESDTAWIDGRGAPAALGLKNCRFVHVEQLGFTADGGATPGAAQNAMRCGVLIEADGAGEFPGITLDRLHVKAVSFENPGFVRPAADVKTANGTTRYGWGIRFLVHSPTARMTAVTVKDCVIERVDHTGLKFTGPTGTIRDVRVENVRVSHSGGPGVQMSGVAGGHFSRLEVDHSGSTSDSRNWGRGSGLWTWGTSDVVIEHSRFTNANGPGDSAGVHIDYNCRDVVVQYNLSAHNAGGFCEILGNNHNCAYRYNVSVNDGYRVKGRDGAFQEGKTFWLSGYIGGRQQPSGPFNSYFYNNTVYVGGEIDAKFAVAPTADGVLVANNIFYVVGNSVRVAGDQSRADRVADVVVKRGVVANNLFLRADNWPTGLGLPNDRSAVGDPQFMRPGGERIEDYTPQNAALVRNRGSRISPLPDDATGLKVGLQVTVDILGRPIVGEPDLGAIELP